MQSGNVTVDGQILPVNFNLNAIRNFCTVNKLKVSQLSAIEEDFDLSIRLAYAGVKEGHRLVGKEYDVTVDDFAAQIGFDGLSSIMQVFADSLPQTESEKNGQAAVTVSRKKLQ